jgi:hypothetical protein
MAPPPCSARIRKQSRTWRSFPRVSPTPHCRAVGGRPGKPEAASLLLSARCFCRPAAFVGSLLLSARCFVGPLLCRPAALSARCFVGPLLCRPAAFVYLHNFFPAKWSGIGAPFGASTPPKQPIHGSSAPRRSNRLLTGRARFDSSRTYQRRDPLGRVLFFDNLLIHRDASPTKPSASGAACPWGDRPILGRHRCCKPKIRVRVPAAPPRPDRGSSNGRMRVSETLDRGSNPRPRTAQSTSVRLRSVRPIAWSCGRCPVVVSRG